MMGETERENSRKVKVRVLFFESNWMTHAFLTFDCNFSPHNSQHSPKYSYTGVALTVVTGIPRTTSWFGEFTLN